LTRFFLLVALSSPAPASPEAESDSALDRFQRGLELFNQARGYALEHPADREEASRLYRQAAASFVAAWKSGAASTKVFTNAANSYFFAGALGEAVLYYKRALSIDPANSRAKEALEHIRYTLPIRKAPSGAGASILRSLFFWHDGLPFTTRRAAFLLFYPGAFLFLALGLKKRRSFNIMGLSLLLPALFLLGSLLVDGFSGPLRKEGVILIEVEGRNGDGTMYSPSHSRPFPPGTEVTIQSVRRGARLGGEAGAWLNVRLLDGKDSWVPEETVEKVIP
jgi:hypothetical protein